MTIKTSKTESSSSPVCITTLTVKLKHFSGVSDHYSTIQYDVNVIASL